jgi:hypothetical protein
VSKDYEGSSPSAPVTVKQIGYNNGRVYLTVDYKRIYDALIQKARDRVASGYYEKHHIVPRCLGGSDEPENIVCLTPEEHYLAHQLLTKIHPSSKGLAKAAHIMCAGRPTNKYYGWVRRRFAEAQRQSVLGESNPVFGTRLIFNPVLQKNKRIGKEELLPEGWHEGAVYNFESYFNRAREKEKKEAQREKKRLAKVSELRNLHEVYLAEGFEGVLRTGYNKSKQNLVMQFAKHLPEFIPQNGKKRGLQQG